MMITSSKKIWNNKIQRTYLRKLDFSIYILGLSRIDHLNFWCRDFFESQLSGVQVNCFEVSCQVESSDRSAVTEFGSAQRRTGWSTFAQSGLSIHDYTCHVFICNNYRPIGVYRASWLVVSYPLYFYLGYVSGREAQLPELSTLVVVASSKVWVCVKMEILPKWRVRFMIFDLETVDGIPIFSKTVLMFQFFRELKIWFSQLPSKFPVFSGILTDIFTACRRRSGNLDTQLAGGLLMPQWASKARDSTRYAY